MNAVESAASQALSLEDELRSLSQGMVDNNSETPSQVHREKLSRELEKVKTSLEH